MGLNIGVFGDSYADRRIHETLMKFKADESWMAHLSKLGHSVSSYGISGSASYHSFTCFKNHHDQFDHIVFCWSYPHRIQTMPFRFAELSSLKDVNQFYSSSSFLKYSKDDQADIVQMLIGYQHLCDLDFNIWAQQKMFDDVNQICREKNIKLVNVLPFIKKSNDEIDFSKKQGDCLYRLIEVTKKEMYMQEIGDVRSTHLFKENNQVLAEIILERFADDENKIVDLFKDPRFTYSTESEIKYRTMANEWARSLGMFK